MKITFINQIQSTRISMYYLLLFIGLPVIARANGIHQHSLSVSEVNLLSDSTDASSWADYGWALWELGYPKADWAFGMALYLDSGCQESRRGLASVESVNGEYTTALGYLEDNPPDDTLSIVMKTAILQHTGHLSESEEILSGIINSETGSF